MACGIVPLLSRICKVTRSRGSGSLTLRGNHIAFGVKSHHKPVEQRIFVEDIDLALGQRACHCVSTSRMMQE